LGGLDSSKNCADLELPVFQLERGRPKLKAQKRMPEGGSAWGWERGKKKPVRTTKRNNLNQVEFKDNGALIKTMAGNKLKTTTAPSKGSCIYGESSTNET